MRNKQYWIDRANRRMDSYTLSAIEQSKVINKAYNRTKTYVEAEIAKILKHTGSEDTLAYEYRMKRLNALLKNTEEKMKELYGINVSDTTAFLKSIIPEAYYHTIFDIAQGTGIQPSFSAVNEKLIDSILKEPWSGENYSKRIWKNTNKLAEDVREVLTEAAMSGESIYKTSRKLTDAFDTSAYNSQRLIRTETTYACNQAEMASYEALDIDKYRFVATLDTRTSPICQKLDGEVFDTKDAQAGKNLPAMHPNCRSTTIPYFEEGMPEERIARDKDGKKIKVPADMKYDEWYKQYINPEGPPKPGKGNTPPPTQKPPEKQSEKPQTKPEQPKPVDVEIPPPEQKKPEYVDTPIPEKPVEVPRPETKPKVEPKAEPEQEEERTIDIKFIPAKTLQEAEEFISQFVNKDQFGAVGIDYKGIDVDAANQINERIAMLYEMFDVDKFGGIVAPAKNTKLGKQIDEAVAGYMPIRNSFVLNRSALKSVKVAEKSFAEEAELMKDLLEHPEKYDFNKMSRAARKVIENAKISGRGTVPVNIPEAITHEFGHALEKKVKKHELWAEVEKSMETFAPKISGYATTEKGEYIAESFASWIKGEDVADPNLIAIFKSLRRK